MGKYLPHGTTLSINSVLVGGLIAVGIPDRSRGEAETTDTNSAFDRTYIPGLREGGTVELTVRHDPGDAGQQQIETNYQEDDPTTAVVQCVITLPNIATSASGGQTYTFDAFVTQPLTGELPLEADEAAEQTAILKVAGGVTIA